MIQRATDRIAMQVTKQHILEDLWMPRTRWRSIARVWAAFGAPYARRAKLLLGASAYASA
jgi:hypothetical protein